MNKNKLGAAAFLSIVAAVLALVDIFLYRTVMYTYTPVYYMLGGVIVLALLGCVLAKVAPRIANYVPIGMVFLLASAIVWGSMLMVNQIAYVISGLDGVDTIVSYIFFAGFTFAAVVISLIASFMKTGVKVEG
jgi:hypothetical protein